MKHTLTLATIILISLPQLPLAAEPAPYELNFGLTLDAKVYTKETIEQRDGILYRRVELMGKTYFLQLTSVQGAGGDLKVFCQNPSGTSEPLVRGGVKVMERTFAFVEGLKIACTSPSSTISDSNFQTQLLPAIAVGFTVDDRVGPAWFRGLKKKKIIVFPFLGIMAETP